MRVGSCGLAQIDKIFNALSYAYGLPLKIFYSCMADMHFSPHTVEAECYVRL